MASSSYSLAFIDSGIASAQSQMQIDKELLLQGVVAPSLRVYGFVAGSITYGHFIRPEAWLKANYESAAQRPTGGGLIFHEGDFSFTLALPSDHFLVKKPTLERYQLINNIVLTSINRLLPAVCCSLQSGVKPEGIVEELCMANPTAYDIILDHKKVGGSAQRKTAKGFIHQCSLFVHPLQWDTIAQKLLAPDVVLPKLQAFTGSIFSQDDCSSEQFFSSLKRTLHQELDILLDQKTFH